MKFARLLELVEDEPVFETGWLCAGQASRKEIAAALGRWLRAGKLVQLRRGLYALAPPYRKVNPSPFLIANRLMPGSYVSTHMALSYAGVIPEHIPVATSCGPGRPHTWDTVLGRYMYQFLRPDLLSLTVPCNTGLRQVEVVAGQLALIATPEKALLDLIHLTPGADAPRWIDGMRLNWQRLNPAQLIALAEKSGRPKWLRAARRLAESAQTRSQSEPSA